MCGIYHRGEFSIGLQLNFQLVFNWFSTGFQLGRKHRNPWASNFTLMLGHAGEGAATMPCKRAPGVKG